MRVLLVHDEMELIAETLGVTLEREPRVVDASKDIKDVAQQILRASYKVLKLQRKLGMDVPGAPKTTLERVTVADVYDATARLAAEMVRIKVHLKIQSSAATPRTSHNKLPTDVFVQVLLVIHNLDLMIEARDAAG